MPDHLKAFQFYTADWTREQAVALFDAACWEPSEFRKKWMESYGLNTDGCACTTRECADPFYFELVKYLHSTFKLTLEDVCANDQCDLLDPSHGNLPLIHYLVTELGWAFDAREALERNADNGESERAKYLIKMFNLTKRDVQIDNNFVLARFISYKDADMVKYLVEKVGFQGSDFWDCRDELCRLFEDRLEGESTDDSTERLLDCVEGLKMRFVVDYRGRTWSVVQADIR